MKQGSYIKLSMTVESNGVHVTSDLQHVDGTDVVMFFLRVFRQSSEVSNAASVAVDMFRGGGALKAFGEDFLDEVFKEVEDDSD